LHRRRLRRRRGPAGAQEHRPPREPPVAARAAAGPDRGHGLQRAARRHRGADRLPSAARRAPADPADLRHRDIVLPAGPHPARRSLYRFHSRAEGLYRGGARRDREHSGCDGRRARPRAPRGVRRGLSLAAHRRRVRRRVQRHSRLLDPDPDLDLQAQGSSRRDRAGAGMIYSLIAVALVALSALAVATFPRSVLVFLLFQGSLLFVFKARIPERLRWGLLAIGLLVLMPTIGYFNSYYLEVATQVGIFVALALGLNIVVGLAGLLDLGYVAF